MGILDYQLILSGFFLFLDDKAMISMPTMFAATTISFPLPFLSLFLRLSVKDFDEAAKLRELDECSLASVDALACAVGPLFVLSLLQGLRCADERLVLAT